MVGVFWFFYLVVSVVSSHLIILFSCLRGHTCQVTMFYIAGYDTVPPIYDIFAWLFLNTFPLHTFATDDYLTGTGTILGIILLDMK